MGKGFKTGGSGGEPDLNFSVKSYPSEVELNTAIADVNTIGVVTTNPITGRRFASEQPENMAEGEVWIVTGTSSLVAFNALKEDTIMIYPLKVKQMVSGELVDLTSKSWMNGKWVDWWNGELFDKGNTFDDVTGGWSAWAWRNQNVGQATFTSGGIYVNPADNCCVAATPNNKIDLTKYSKISFKLVENTFNTDGRVWFAAKAEKDKSENMDARLDIGELSSGTYSLDISGLNGEYYVGVFAWNGTSATYLSVTVDEVRLG